MSTAAPIFRLTLAITCLLALAGCNETFSSAGDRTGSFGREVHSAGTVAPLKTTVGLDASDSDYQIAPLDVLEISVFQVKDLDGVRQVSRTGHISMPLIGELAAKGKSVKQLEREIAARLGANYLRAPDVHVSVKDYASQRFTVEGAVNAPGIYSMSGRTTLLQAIAQAKGLSRIADREVAVFRRTDDNRIANRYDLSSIRSGEVEDPVIVGGDIVVVGDSAIRTVWTEFKDVFGVGMQGVGVASRFIIP